MTEKVRLLLLEDRPADAELILRELRKQHIEFEAKCVATEREFRAQLHEHRPDLILADYALPGYDGLSALAVVRQERPQVPFIFVSGTLGEEKAIEALKHGATDYVLKHRLARLGPAVKRALAEVQERAQRRQTEELLRASERNYREIFNASNDAIVLHDADTGAILDVNERALEMFGYAREELMAVTGGQFRAGAPYSHQEAVRRIRQASAEGPQVFEWRSKRKNGELFWTEVALRAAEVGGQKRVLAVVRDITERKHADREVLIFARLGQQLGATKNAREAAEIIVAVADELIGWDACTLDLYSPEEDRLIHVLNRDTVAGQRKDFPSAYQNEPPSRLVRRTIEQGGQLVLKENPEAMQPDGKAFGNSARPSAAIMLVPIRDGQQVIGLLSMHSYTPKAYHRCHLDTLQALADHCAGTLERLSAQAALGQSEANYRLLVERSPDAILLHRDRVFVYANPAALKLLGAEKPEQILGRSALDIAPPENHDLVRQRLQRVVEGSVAPAMEQKILRLNGSAVEVEATSMPFIHEGKPAVQTVMRDITGRKQLEQQLRQAQKMEAIGQLAGGVAHDFNNLLAVMRGNAELLLLDPKQHSAETQECLKQITAASERAANLTRQLLAFSRKQVMQSRPLVLNDVVADLTKMLKRIIGEHIDLQCQYAAHLPFVQADPGMVEQVLVNLAVNARDAMPRGGQLLITTEQFRGDEAQLGLPPEARPGPFVCLTVKDAGTGIAPEHLPHIFEPFFTTKERGKGTGLGLATVYGIVKQHNGWIEVDSQPGAGAAFSIFLPAIPPPPAADEKELPEAAVPGGSETILLVEDDYAVRIITRRVLEGHGYKILEASSAREARELWRGQEEKIDLLLSDIVMPEGVTGRELAEQLRAERATLRVILMSGYSADVVGKNTEFFRRGGTYFVQKPCASRALLETVRQCLDAPEPASGR